MAPTESRPLWQRIRERKLVQWGFAYLAGAWVALQLLAILAGIYDWPDPAQRWLTAVLALGLPVALVLGWYHGEQGRQRVSTGEILVLAGLLLATGVGLALLRGQVEPARERAVAVDGDGPVREAVENSVAVLPFANISADPDNAYFSDGITEEIISALSRQPQLKVAARTSSFFYQDKQVPVPEIGEQLGVSYVLEGSVRRESGRVRITAQLINAGDGYHRWSESYDRRLDDTFQVQTEIAEAVVSALELTLHGNGAQAGGTPTVDAEARELYYKAIYIAYDQHRFREDHPRAIRMLQRALEIDPEYALAHATLAGALSNTAIWGLAPTGQVLGEAKARAARALELAPRLDEAHIARGRVAMLELDWPTVQRSMRQAVALNPNSPRAHASLSIAATYDGQWDDALHHSRVAAQLDPVSAGPVDNYAEMLNILGRSGEAVRVLEETLALNPALTSLYPTLVRSYVLDARVAPALATAERFEELEPGATATLVRAFALAHDGEGERARRLLEGLGKPRSEDLVSWVMTLIALGERERALALSERAVEEIPLNFAIYAYLPELDPLRGEPRFRRALARLNIPDPNPPAR